MDQISNFAAEHSGYYQVDIPLGSFTTDMFHVNCRCQLTGWQSTRQMPAALSTGQELGLSKQLYSTKELGRAVAEAVKAVIIVKEP